MMLSGRHQTLSHQKTQMSSWAPISAQSGWRFARLSRDAFPTFTRPCMRVEREHQASWRLAKRRRHNRAPRSNGSRTSKRASRWYLIGSDYVWPWLSHRAIKKYIADAGGSVVGEEFVPMGDHDHSAQLARIGAARPDVVLISLIGTDSIVFNRAFAEQGLASKMLRLAGAMDETVLLGIGVDNTENLFCASGYFVDMASRENDAFRCQYEASFGRYAPPLGSVGQSNYEGLRFLETVASHAGSLAIKPLLSIATNVDYQGARGRIGVRRGSANMPIYLAEANGLDFRLIRKF